MMKAYLGIVENVREEKIEKSPEFVEVVLERRTGDEQPIGRFEFAHNLRELRFLVLDAVSFVNHHVAPAKLLEDRPLLHDDLVRGDTNVPFTWHDLIADNVGLECQ